MNDCPGREERMISLVWARIHSEQVDSTSRQIVFFISKKLVVEPKKLVVGYFTTSFELDFGSWIILEDWHLIPLFF